MREEVESARCLLVVGLVLVAAIALETRAACASTPSHATGKSCLDRILGPTVHEVEVYTIVPPGARNEIEPGRKVAGVLTRLQAETDACLSPLSGRDSVYIVRWGGTRLRLVHDRSASEISFSSMRHTPFALSYDELGLFEPELRIEQVNQVLVVHLVDTEDRVDARIIIDMSALDLGDARVEIYEEKAGPESEAEWEADWGDEMTEYTASEQDE